MEELGWSILNGNVVGDEEGEWTYSGGRRGGTVIDYVIGNEEKDGRRGTRERVKRMRMEERVDSDHQPITVWMEGGGRRSERRRNKRKEGESGQRREEGSLRNVLEKRISDGWGWKRGGRV